MSNKAVHPALVKMALEGDEKIKNMILLYLNDDLPNSKEVFEASVLMLLIERSESAQAEIEQLEKLLGKFGSHTEQCQVPSGECNCGYERILDGDLEGALHGRIA